MASNTSETAKPVPQPRRTITTNNNHRTTYENVSIDLINKNININNDNLQHNRKPKIQNEKSFLASETAATVTTGVTDVNNLNIDRNRNVSPKNFEESHKLNNLPVPAPRRTAAQIQQEEIYENNEEVQLPKPKPPRPAQPPKLIAAANAVPESLPTISKAATTRKAPEIPLPPPPPYSPDKRYNNTATSSGVIIGGGNEASSKQRLDKSVSNTSLNSTHSGNSANDSTSSSPKYITTSPASLFKSLGATSKLLSESITERVSVRTKDAKHKIDKMHQSSLDLVTETKKMATIRLKNVRKNLNSKIGDNFSLGRSDEKKASSDYSLERPQTVPANDELFQSISFNSPLNAKTVNSYDLTESSYEVPRKSISVASEMYTAGTSPSLYPSLYKLRAETYRSSTVDSDSSDEGSSGKKDFSIFERNSTVTQSMFSSLGTSETQRQLPVARIHQSDEDLTDAKLIGTYKLLEAESPPSPEERPCPSYPPPVNKRLSEGHYGKLLKSNITSSTDSDEPIRAPVRTKRRKEYEETQIRAKPTDMLDNHSNRATIDSNEYKTVPDPVRDDRIPRIFSRDISSTDYSDRVEMEEKMIPSPSRSESWTFYDANEDGSSPEPIYANDGSTSVQPFKEAVLEDIVRPAVRKKPAKATVSPPVSESVYGVLYEKDLPGKPMLIPQSVSGNRNKQSDVGEPASSADIIREFDPLILTAIDEICSNKSNELILLENLLGKETYGTHGEINEENASVDAVSVTSYISEDEEVLSGEQVLPKPPLRLDSLELTSKSQRNSDERRTVIIHQNLNLRSDSMEDILDAEEAAVAPYLAKVENIAATVVSEDLSYPSPSRSNWFVNETSAEPKPSNVTLKAGEALKTSTKTKSDCCPPAALAPPTYSEAIGETTAAVADASPKTSIKTMFSNVLTKMEGINLSIKRKSSVKGTTPAVAAKSDVQTIIEMIPKPMLTQRHIIHEGNLIRLPSAVSDDILKEQHMRKAFIRERKFQAYFDKELKTTKENFSLDHITTIQCVSKHKFTNNSVELHCFEITTATPKNTSTAMNNALSNPNMVMTSTNSGNTKTQRVCHLYGVAKESDRFIWMQKLLEGMTDVFQTGYTCKFYRAGWCYLKNSITSQWSGAWILLQKQKKKLVCYNCADMNLELLDLRKARCLVLKDSDDSVKNLHVESGPMLMIDCPPYSMYMIMSSPRETKIWRHILREVAHNNGPSLKEQQLTKHDVPVLVDKCINFVYAHGSMSEGIYRKSGSENSVQKLLALFRTDAFSVQITRTEYNEHDVANVLKRFMRDLPDRLLGKYSASFVAVAEMKSKTEKVTAYKELLRRLPSIEFHTLRKLIGHLNFIQSQKIRNKMGVDNLAIVWGPTLLEDKTTEMQFSQKEADVIVELIMLYKNLYQLTPDELAKEQIMLTVLQKYHAAAENLSDSVKKSGDLKVWITLDPSPDNEQEEKRQINVSLSPNKTVHDVCKELAPKMKRQPFNVTLSEVILDGDLRRPLHYSERVFDIVLRWSYWPEADRKNNFLQLQPMKYLKEVQRALKNLPVVSPNKELKFADCKTKAFKSYTLEMTDACITVMKKEKSSSVVKVRDIDLNKATAYLGCERKRDFQLRWAITLIENDADKRTRESPFFGHVIAGTNSNDSLVWYSSILHSLYGEDILPNPEIIIP